jgi:hypothetical protein
MKDLDLRDRLGRTDAERTFWLTQGIARTVGVNLTTEMAEGRLTMAEYADMMVQCSDCAHAETCVRWMAEGGHGDTDPPAYCLNHERIEALAAARR